MISDVAFIAGIADYQRDEPYHFDVAILNQGGHFNPDDGSYIAPYSGLYQFTVAFESDEATPKFNLAVDNIQVAYARNFDDTDFDNSLILTRNLHLNAGQKVTLNVAEIDAVYGESNTGQDGYYSWFTGHLIYIDN